MSRKCLIKFSVAAAILGVLLVGRHDHVLAHQRMYQPTRSNHAMACAVTLPACVSARLRGPRVAHALPRS
jgi:hypothetical protein